jgi:hypothetical protein
MAAGPCRPTPPPRVRHAASDVVVAVHSAANTVGARIPSELWGLRVL